MARTNFIMPLDQPLARRRLLAELQDALRDNQFSDFRLIVAYVKSGPLHRLKKLLEGWRRSGKTAEAIFGIDQQGTSREALEQALGLFDAVYVTREPLITFHPKIYQFTGQSSARAFIGSNNLTVGGTETNFEAAVRLDLDLQDDSEPVATLQIAWEAMLPDNCPATTLLDLTALGTLVENGDVVSERAMHRSGTGSSSGTNRARTRSGLAIKPASPLPKESLARAGQRRRVSRTTPVPAVANGLAIQIKPHHNGEIFLSLSAALQNPEFFRWPFTGATVPKKVGNPSYPQLDPDPVVNIVVYGAPTEPLLTLPRYRLNTVYYEAKSEIRITASPLVRLVSEYSVMIMSRSDTPGIDYEIIIHTPDSPDYQSWVNACNQVMPSGGSTPRMYGWF